MSQAIENIPAGPVNVDVGERTALPNKRMVYSTIEGLISHFELSMSNRGFETPCEESYAAIDSPNGELGFYLVGDGTEVSKFSGPCAITRRSPLRSVGSPRKSRPPGSPKPSRPSASRNA